MKRISAMLCLRWLRWRINFYFNVTARRDIPEREFSWQDTRLEL